MALADGDGTFAAAQYSKPATGDFSSYAAHIGDFNGDGVSDLVAAYDGPGGLSANVSLANGDGTLAAAQYSKSATGDFSSYAAHVGDFDGDGISDLVWTKSDGSGLYAQVALANGDGTLAAAVGELLGLRGPCGRFSTGTAISDLAGPAPSDLLRPARSRDQLFQEGTMVDTTRHRSAPGVCTPRWRSATAMAPSPRRKAARRAAGGLLGLSGRCR